MVECCTDFWLLAQVLRLDLPVLVRALVSRVSELLWWASWLRSPASWARVSS